MYENIDDTNFEAQSISYLDEIGIPSLEVHEWRSKFTNSYCLEFNISKNSIRIMTVEQFDSITLKLIKATDLEDIGIPSMEDHIIVGFTVAVRRYLNKHLFSRHDFDFSRRYMNMWILLVYLEAVFYCVLSQFSPPFLSNTSSKRWALCIM